MASKPPAAVIKPIDKGTIHRICSGQVILDLATAVKELVENALDAGATSIEIRLKEYGSELLEVADNGHGVAPSNYQALTLKYHTSKISGFGDLQELATFGFRGEALSSLCAVADVSVVTRTAEQGVGVRLTYDANGRLVGQEGAARTVGTTVAVRDLFNRLPVRHKEFLRHLRREYARLVGLLQAYALISTGVRLICTNQVGNSPRTTVVNTQCGASIRDNILAVFGSKAAEGMEALEVREEESGVTAAGWVSKANVSSGRAAGDRQFFFLNGRPVELPKAARLLNDTYRSLSSPAAAASKPMAVVDFRLPRDSYDVNVTPDKRKVFLHAEKRILEALQRGLAALWEPSRNTFSVNDALGVAQQAQQAQRGDAAAARVAAGARSLPSFGQFAATPGHAAARSPAAGASPGTKRRVEEGQEGRQATPAASPSKPAGGVAAGRGSASPAEPSSGDPGEPPAKRRTQLPLAAYALGAAGQQGAAGGAVAGPREGQQPAMGRQQSLLSFGFQRGEAPGSQEGGCRGQAAAVALEGEAEGQGGGDLAAGGGVVAAAEPCTAREQQPAVAAAVLQTTPSAPGGSQGGQQQQQQGPAATTAAVGEESEDDALYDASDGEEQEGGLQAAAAGAAQAAAGAAAGVASDDGAGGAAYAADAAGDIAVAVDLAGMRQRLLAAARASAAAAQQGARRGRSRFAAASLAGGEGAGGGGGALSREQAEAVAEAELARVFAQPDFLRLRLLGQFNLGFILAALGRDLFIVDQHASDEKYNFERLQRSTTLNRQPLLVPQPLDLSPTEELTVRDHMDVFRQNGFDFADNPSSGRLMLAAVPFSKNVTFGASDVLELAALLDSGAAAPYALGSAPGAGPASQPGAVVRPSRVRAMLASRACRSSIMIGRALEPRAQRAILDHLAALHSPWNCPHGRPTMRHLALLPPRQPALHP